MCSNTHIAGLSASITWRSSSPPSVSETISPGRTSRIIFAPMMSKAQLSEATTKSVVELAERQRPNAVRVAEGDHRVLGHDHGREGALEPRHHLGHGVLDVGAPFSPGGRRAARR